MSVGWLPLVGRDELLAEIRTALDQARVSRGGLVLLTGEAGIGKTRLASETVSQASGFRAVWSWCASDPAGGSFRPWLHVVRELASADPRVAGLVAASPWLSGLSAHEILATDAHAGNETLRWQLFDEVADVLRSAAATVPLLIVLDDLHDAQESSLWLLAHLVPQLRSSAAMVLATARDGEQAWHGHVAAHAALLRQANSLSLAPFTRHQIGELIESVPNSCRSPLGTEGVLARTSGNPLLVVELIRSAAQLPTSESAGLAIAVPASVRAMTAERLSTLSGAAQRLLSAAAVLGSHFGLDFLASVAEIDGATVRDVLTEAEAIALVEFSDAGHGRFVHELIRDAVYDGLAPLDRVRWHTRTGELLISAAQRGAEVTAAEIAYHLLRAGPECAVDASRFAELAGDRACEVLAFEDAVSWYERALRAQVLAGGNISHRARVVLALSAARLGCGDRAGAREGFLQAASLARGCDLPETLAHAALGLGSGPGGFEVTLMDQQQLDLLEEASKGLPEHSFVLRALVMARLSVARSLVDREERRVALAEDALRLARQSQDDLAQASAVAALCDALAGPDHTQARLASSDEIIERATRLRDPALELLGRRLRLVALLESGDRFAADSETTAYRIRAEAFRHPLYTWYIPLWRAMWALAEGRFDDARTLNELAEVQGTSAGSHNAFLLVTTQRWCLLAEAEDRAGLEQLTASVDFDQDGGLWARISSMLVTAQLGDHGLARRQLDAVAAQLPSLPRDSEWLPCVAQIAETLTLVGPHPVAEWLYQNLRPYADLFVVEGIGAALRGPVQRYLAIAAAALGDQQRAESHFASAIDAARTLGAPGMMERMQRELSRWVPDTRAVDVGGDNVFRPAGDYWMLRFRGQQVQLRDSKGLHDLAVLLARPGVHVAALDLVGASTSGTDTDTGEVLDATARGAYRQRLRELEAEAVQADAAADIERSARIANERDALVEQLTAAYGLGGRGRRVGSTAERARTSVTARIRETMRRIAAAHPELGRHLVRSVRTGTFCVYEPEVPVRWQA